VLDLDNIKAEMARNNITGLMLAKHLGISANSLYSKLNGKREFSASELGMISKMLKKTVNFFYKWLC